jgi:hypothetical protein
MDNIEIGDKVVKKSRKPFKGGSLIEEVVSFDTNTADPKGRQCAVFENGSVCNVDLLEIDPIQLQRSEKIENILG